MFFFKMEMQLIYLIMQQMFKILQTLDSLIGIEEAFDLSVYKGWGIYDKRMGEITRWHQSHLVFISHTLS